jgi:alpha-1,2-mannosyltransferase
MNTRWVFLVALYLAFGLLGAWYLFDTTSLGADLATYQRAGDALWSTGDPYAAAAGFPEDYRYRYPPLLAMVIPVLGWPPLWFALIAIATVVPVVIGYRVSGPAGLLPVALLVGAWAQQLLNGNAQAFVVALLAIVPLSRVGGAIGLAVATMLKLHPALAVVWYVGRREWRPLGWYAAAMAVLTLLQLPWLPAMVRFYLTDSLATETIPGMSLRAIGLIPWVVGTAVVAVAALWFARSRYGWLLATVLQLVALPRVLLVNLALLLAAPLPRPAAEGSSERPTPAPPARGG